MPRGVISDPRDPIDVFGRIFSDRVLPPSCERVTCEVNKATTT